MEPLRELRVRAQRCVDGFVRSLCRGMSCSFEKFPMTGDTSPGRLAAVMPIISGDRCCRCRAHAHGFGRYAHSYGVLCRNREPHGQGVFKAQVSGSLLFLLASAAVPMNRADASVKTLMRFGVVRPASMGRCPHEMEVQVQARSQASARAQSWG